MLVIPTLVFFTDQEQNGGGRKDITAEHIEPSPERMNLTVPAAPLGHRNRSLIGLVLMSSALHAAEVNCRAREEGGRADTFWTYGD